LKSLNFLSTLISKLLVDASTVSDYPLSLILPSKLMVYGFPANVLNVNGLGSIYYPKVLEDF